MNLPPNHPEQPNAASSRTPPPLSSDSPGAERRSAQRLHLSKPVRRVFSRRFVCAVVLAAVLFWRAPIYIEAQTLTKDSEKNNSSNKAKTNTPAVSPETTAPRKPTATDAQKPSSASKDSVPSDEKLAEKKKDGDAKTGDDKSSDEILVSFQGANIDMIVQWLAQTSGKSVLKHPRVQCQLTIVGSKKVNKREALNLVYRALALEG